MEIEKKIVEFSLLLTKNTFLWNKMRFQIMVFILICSRYMLLRNAYSSMTFVDIIYYIFFSFSYTNTVQSLWITPFHTRSRWYINGTIYKFFWSRNNPLLLLSVDKIEIIIRLLVYDQKYKRKRNRRFTFILCYNR